MKILIAHNAYQHSGGEDVVMHLEAELLRAYGHDVTIYHRHNIEINTMSKTDVALSALWSSRSTSELEKICRSFRPDVIHAHNTFPLISPAFYWMAADKRIPVVQTLHNFRLLCPQATLLRAGKVCEDCVTKFPWRAVTRKCYQESAINSAVVASMLGIHRLVGTYRQRSIRYIALTQFCRDKFIQGGLPARLFHIKPNFVRSISVPNWEKRKGGVYLGRLSEEKGIVVLVKATEKLNTLSVPIKVVGTGPLEPIAKEATGLNCVGFKDHNEVRQLLGQATYVVAPSICYETFSLAVIEAFSCGTAVIASRHGAFSELIKDGVTGMLFNPGDSDDLASKVSWAEANPHEMLKMGKAARLEYEKKYTPARNYNLLMHIYEDAICGAG